jgi:hypothetical protein
MDNYNTYIDLMGQLCHLIKDGKVKSIEANSISDRMKVLWSELTEEEQCLADEQTFLTRLYMGI